MSPPERRWTTAIVRGVFETTSGVRTLDLMPKHGVVRYPLGSHIEVEVRLGNRSATRCYSLVGKDPQRNAYRIAVKRVRDSRGGSRFLWQLKRGDIVGISEPKSHFELNPGAREYLLVAGGIGITPLVGMAEALVDSRAPFRLLYAGSAREQMAFLPDLQKLLGERLSVFASTEGRRIDLAAAVRALHGDAELYVCGPIGLMEAAQRVWRSAGRSASRLRLETFGSSGHQASERFRVQVVDHGVELEVAREQSLLEALSGAGIDVPGHCQRGECGLCAVQVVKTEGALDHRDVFLDDDQKADGRIVCPCVSRAAGSIAIDTGYRDEL
jgi:vanillate O-demethylase ferredoxin subunit